MRLNAKFLFAGLLAFAGGVRAQPGRSPVETGRNALELLLAGQFPQLSGTFSDSLKQTVTLEFLQDRVSAELKEFGKVQAIGDPVTAADGANRLVSFPVRFANAGINVQFTLNAAGQVAGMFFRPANKPLPAMWKLPGYSKPETLSGARSYPGRR